MTRTRTLLNRLSSAFSRSPDSNLCHLGGVIADEYDGAAYTLQDLLGARAYLTAAGSSLDRIVALLGVTRLAGESDDALRTRYAIELNRRRISGTREEVLDAINANSDLQYGEDYLLLEPPNIPPPSRNQAAFLVDLLKDGGYLQYDPDRLYAILQAVKPVGVLPTFRHRRTLHGMKVGGSTTSIHTERALSVMPGMQVSQPTTTPTRHVVEDLDTWNQDFSDLAGWTTVIGGSPFAYNVSATGALDLSVTNNYGAAGSIAVKQTIDLTDVGEIYLDVHVTSDWCLKYGYFDLLIAGTSLVGVADGDTCGDPTNIPAPWHRNIYVDVRGFTGPVEVAFMASVGSSAGSLWSTYAQVDNVRFVRPV